MKFKCRKCGRKFQSREKKEKHVGSCKKKQTQLPIDND